MTSLVTKDIIKKNDFILDDDYNHYHIHYINNKQHKQIIKYDEVLRLLKKGLEYKYTSNYGLYRLMNFKSKIFLDSFNTK